MSMWTQAAGGAYATYWNQGFYVNGGIYGGYNSYDTSRETLLQGRLANGNTECYEFSTFVDTGYDFHFGNLSIGPVFSAQYTNVHVDGFTEHGDAAGRFSAGSAKTAHKSMLVDTNILSVILFRLANLWRCWCSLRSVDPSTPERTPTLSRFFRAFRLAPIPALENSLTGPVDSW